MSAEELCLLVFQLYEAKTQSLLRVGLCLGLARDYLKSKKKDN